MPAARYDIKNESFDLYFIKQLLALSEERLEQIPMDIQFKYKSDMTPNDIKTMGFMQKLYILSRFCKKKVFIVAENEDGMSLEDFAKARNRSETFDMADDVVAKMYTNGVFSVGGEQVLESVSGLEQLSNSPVYRYMNGLKTGKIVATDYDKAKIASTVVCRFLQDYEAYKARVSRSRSYGAEKLMLLMFYSDGQKKSLAGAYNSLRMVQKTVASKLMIEMTNAKWFIVEGKGKNTVYRMTALGFHQLSLMLRDILKISQ